MVRAYDKASRRSRQLRALAIGTVVSALLLAIALRGVDGGQLVATLRRGDPALLGVTFAFMTASFLPRAARWRLLLARAGEVGLAPVLWATTLGYLGNLLLPARAGEAIRSVLLARVVPMRVSYVLATALAERAVDVVAMGLVCAAAVLALPSPPGGLVAGAVVAAALALAGLATIAIAPTVERTAPALAARLPRVGASAQARTADIATQFARGVGAIGARGVAGRFALLTVVVVACDALAIVAASAAFDLPLGPAGSLVFLAALALASAMPSTPGYVGTYQFAAVSVLPTFGLDRTEAIACVVGLQAVNVVAVLLWGSIGLVRLRAVARAQIDAAATTGFV